MIKYEMKEKVRSPFDILLDLDNLKRGGFYLIGLALIYYLYDNFVLKQKNSNIILLFLVFFFIFIVGSGGRFFSIIRAWRKDLIVEFYENQIVFNSVVVTADCISTVAKTGSTTVGILYDGNGVLKKCLTLYFKNTDDMLQFFNEVGKLNEKYKISVIQ